jgi:hypothetical protein
MIYVTDDDYPLDRGCDGTSSAIIPDWSCEQFLCFKVLLITTDKLDMSNQTPAGERETSRRRTTWSVNTPTLFV